MQQGVIISRYSTQICGKRRKNLHPVDKKKPTSLEGDGLPSALLCCSNAQTFRRLDAQASRCSGIQAAHQPICARLAIRSRSFPLMHLLAHEVDTHQKQRQ